MEDFAVDFEKKREGNGATGALTGSGSGVGTGAGAGAKSDALDMSVSAICEKDGRRFAYVTFAGGGRKAEGEIPSCMISSSEGFSDEEVHQLEVYMRQNLDMLRKMAADINPLKAFMK